MPTKVIQIMETEAYKYAKAQNYDLTGYEYPGYEGKIAMKDLFEMIAGTSTGSIIAASLAMPKNETINGETRLSKNVPKFFADDIIEIYRNDNDKIFDKNQFSTLWVVLFNVLTFPLFVYFGYYWGTKKFDNDEKMHQFRSLRRQVEDLQIQPSEPAFNTAINDDQERPSGFKPVSVVSKRKEKPADADDKLRRNSEFLPKRSKASLGDDDDDSLDLKRNQL